MKGIVPYSFLPRVLGSDDNADHKPNRDTVNPDDHPLKALRRDDKAEAFRTMIRNIPLDKIDQSETMLAGLQNGE